MPVHLSGERCSPHRRGVLPGMPPFYQPGCIACEAKKAAGVITGNEPLPPRRGKEAQGAWRGIMFARRAENLKWRRDTGRPDESP